MKFLDGEMAVVRLDVVQNVVEVEVPVPAGFRVLVEELGGQDFLRVAHPRILLLPEAIRTSGVAPLKVGMPLAADRPAPVKMQMFLQSFRCMENGRFFAIFCFDGCPLRSFVIAVIAAGISPHR